MTNTANTKKLPGLLVLNSGPRQDRERAKDSTFFEETPASTKLSSDSYELFKLAQVLSFSSTYAALTHDHTFLICLSKAKEEWLYFYELFQENSGLEFYGEQRSPVIGRDT